MSIKSGTTVAEYLEKLGVEVHPNTAVEDYDGETVSLRHRKTIHSHCLIWAAGVKGVYIPGVSANAVAANDRLLVDQYNHVRDLQGKLCYW